MGTDRVEAGDGRTIVFVFGDVDMTREAELLALFEDAVGMGQPVVIDAAGIDFIDSSGLRALVIGHQLCEKAGLPLGIRNLTPGIGRVLEIGGLDGLIPRMD
jgi:anti-anti-sigma factor